MSKNHREARKPAHDWEVRLAPVGVNKVAAARMERDVHGGYTFTDDKGTVADYPPGTVLSVTRADPEPEPKTAEAGSPNGQTEAEREKAALVRARRNNIGRPQAN